MKRHPSAFCLLALALIGSTGIYSSLSAQTRDPSAFVGVHFGMNLSNFGEDPVDLARVGAQVAVPIAGPISLYPMASIHLDRAQWQISMLARIDPGPSGRSAAFYLGGGFSHLNWDGPVSRFYDVLLGGLKITVGAYQPFVELQLLGGVERLTTGGGDFGVQLYLGLNRSVE